MISDKLPLVLRTSTDGDLDLREAVKQFIRLLHKLNPAPTEMDQDILNNSLDDANFILKAIVDDGEPGTVPE